MLLITAAFVIAYTLLGGFWAVCVSDFVQALVMICALIAVFGFGIAHVGGFGPLFENVGKIPGFLDFFGMASPQVNEAKEQIIQYGTTPLWNSEITSYGFLVIISTMSWGLGYFGMPQVLIRFMAIKDESQLTRARRVAIVWCVVAMAAAIFIGLMGRAIFPGFLSTGDSVGEDGSFAMSASDAESVFIKSAQLLFHPIAAGFAMAGILAAAMSSSDSYLLIASSSVAKDLFKDVLKKEATDKEEMILSRVTLTFIGIIAVIIAWDEHSVIFKVVSFAWAGFGAAFGPLMLFSLFWKRLTYAGAVAGLAAGGVMVFVWKLLVRPLGGVYDLYELLPAFLASCITIVAVSLLTQAPSEEITQEFEKAGEKTEA
jgi:sodium/proline symporter